MSIADAIVNAQNKIKAIYTKCKEKGATLPETQDLANLPATVDSIPAGSGEGSTELKVAAFGSAQTASENTKVFLVPYSEIGGGDIPVTDGLSSAGSGASNMGKCSSEYGLMGWNNGSSGQICSLSEDNAATYTLKDDLYTHWDLDPTVILKNTLNSGAVYMGFGSPDAFIQKAYRGERPGAFYGVKGGFMFQAQNYPNYIIYNSDTQFMTQKALMHGERGGFFLIHEEELYLVKPYSGNVVKCNTKDGTEVVTFNLTTKFSDLAQASIGYSLVPSGDYFLTWNTAGDIQLCKLTKGSTWTIERLTTLPVSQGGNVQLIRSSETPDSIHVYIVPSICTDTENVKHFVIDKATGTVKKMIDLLDSTGYTTILASGFKMDMSRASFILYNGSDALKCVVSGLDAIIPYQYAAVPFNKANLTNSAITGFVKSQDGSDVFGNSLATVEALTDPNAPPFDISSQVLGMRIIVTEGDPS